MWKDRVIFMTILRKFKISYTFSIIFLFILVFAIIDRLTPRPHLMSYLFFSLTLLIIIQYRYIDRKKTKYLYFLPLIFLLWGNMHMGILAGLLLIGVYYAAELITFFIPKKFSSNEIPSLTKPELIRLLLIFIACVLVMLINPNGIQTYFYAYEHTKMKMLSTVNEWMSPFSSNYNDGFVSYIYKAFLFTGFLTIFYSFSKKDVLPGLLFIIFGIYSVRAMRFTVDYVLILFPFLILTYFYYLFKIKSAVLKDFLIINPVPKIILSLGLFLLIFPVKDNSFYLGFMKYYRISGFGINSEFIPTQMFDFIKENKIADIGEKPFNHFGTGGFIVWNFPGKQNFIDSRNLSDEIFYKYDSLIRKMPGFEKKFNDYGFDYVIYLDPDYTHWDLNTLERMKNNTILSYLTKSDDWKLVFWDDKSVLYVKNLPKFKDIIDKYEYKYLTPFYYPFTNETEKSLVNKGLNEDKLKLKSEIKRKAAEEPESVVMHVLFNAFGNKLTSILNN